MRRFFYISLLLVLPLVCPAQQGTLMPYTVEKNDTIFLATLNPAYAFIRPPKGTKDNSWGDYYRTVWNFNKAYPYALRAAEKVREVDSVLAVNSRTTREREKIVKDFEQKLFKEFEKPLRNLTFTQGRMLLKLIDREVGQNSFYIIKDYRGNITAGFWQGIAKIFGADLKKPYDRYGDDKVLEELVVMYHEGSFPYLYASLFGR